MINYGAWHFPLPLLVILGIHLLQTALYYKRLPDPMACKFDFSLRPSRWCGKPVYVVPTLLGVFGLCAAAFYGPVPLIDPILMILLFLAIVNQYVYAANAGSLTLHSSFFVVITASTFLFGWLVLGWAIHFSATGR